MKCKLSHRGTPNITLLISTSLGTTLAIRLELDRDRDIDIISGVARMRKGGERFHTLNACWLQSKDSINSGLAVYRKS